jgi:hypothetical protein
MILTAESIAEAVRFHGGVNKAARALGVPESTFKRHIKQIATEGKPKLRVNKMANDPVLTGGYDANRIQFATCGQNGAQPCETAVILCDIHLPYESQEHVEVALDYAFTHHNPRHIILDGDLVDFMKISRFVSPSDAMPLVAEISYAVEWLEKLRKRFPRHKITYIQGNHEERLQRFIWTRSPELDGLKGLNVKDQLELERLNIHFVDNMKLKRESGKFYSIGKLTILHGHELGICPNINPARQYFLKALDNVFCGHVHKVNDHYDTTVRDETKGAFVCGCLCDMHPAYKPQNGWVAGFALAHFEADGMFSVEPKKIIRGRVL